MKAKKNKYIVAVTYDCDDEAFMDIFAVHALRYKEATIEANRHIEKCICSTQDVENMFVLLEGDMPHAGKEK